MAKSPVLKVSLLGSPQIEWEGRLITIQRRNVRGLLYRLAAEARRVPRDRLCFLFWPDIPEPVARRNLTHLLTHLRMSLPEPGVLVSADDAVGLNTQRIWCDAVEMRQLVHAGKQSKAVELYRGSFLAGFSLSKNQEFEDWISSERTSFERMYLDTLASLVERGIDQQAYDQAIRYAQRYLESDDLAEEIHRRLIALYALVGERNLALRQYEYCATALERELGVSPLPETRAVYQTILKGYLPSLLKDVQRTERPIVSLPKVELPLIGRDQVMEVLDRRLHLAQDGQAQMVLISGEAGIGKSRLIHDFIARCQPENRIFFGSGYSGGQAVPYQPIVEALRSINLVDSSIHLSPIWLAEISRLLPELRSRYPDLPPPLPVEPEDARTRLFDALCQVILSVGPAQTATVFCLDDLQWVDRTTLDWLVHLGRHVAGGRIQAAPLLVVGAYRSEDFEVVEDFCLSLAGLGLPDEIRLNALEETATLEMLQHLAGHLPGDEIMASRLHQTTGGNPFFLLEMLGALMEEGKLQGDLSEMGDFPLPKGIREAVESRLRRLDAKTRQVLDAGAILGSVFGFDLIHQTAGRGDLEVMDSLDELVARHLLVEQEARYRFAHEITHRAVEASLNPVRCQLLHRRAGQALERLQPESAASLAYHFEAGGVVKKALRYHDLAAQKARSVFAWQEAEFHQGRMLDLMEQIDPDYEDRDMIRKRGNVLAERATIRFVQGRIAERDADLDSLADLAEASDEEGLLLLALTQQAFSLSHSGRYGEAIASAEKGLILAERLDDRPSRLRFLAQLGLIHYLTGQPRAALAALEPARTLSEQEDNLELRGDVSQFLGHVHFHLGNYVKALAYHQESLECSRLMGDRSDVTWCTLNVGFQLLKLGAWDESNEFLNRGLNLARQIDIPIGKAFALMLLGNWELYRGSYLAAIDFFLQSLPIHQAAHAEHNIAATEEPLGMVYYQLGDLIKAREWLERAVDRVRSIGYRRLLATVLVDLGLLEIAEKHLDVARRFLMESIAGSRECECRENLVKGLAALAGLERQAHHLDLALSYAQEAVQLARESVLPACESWGEMEAGLALLARGEYAEALDCTSHAVSLLPQAHEAWIGTEQVHFAHAQCLQALTQVEHAVEHERLAWSIIRAKADKIPDPGSPKQYLAMFRDRPKVS